MAAGFKKATVNASLVPATQSNFPSYVDLSRLGITTLAEAQSVRVYADSAKTTEWAREIVSATEMHVKIPSLTSTVEMYVDYDGVRADYAVTATYGRNAVWSDYACVYHYATLTTSSTGNNTTTNNNSVTSATGKLGDGAEFVRTSSKYFSIASGSQTGLGITGNAITLQCWYRGNSDMNNRVARIIWRLGGTGSYGYQLSTSGNAYSPNNAFTISAVGTGGGTDFGFGTTGDATSTTFKKVDATYDGTNFRGYVNATNTHTSGTLSNRLTNANAITIAFGANSAPSDYLTGILDELRIRGSVLSANWIATEYNNQNDEASFWGTWSDVGNRGGILLAW